jgi:hypothetical protein
VSGFRSTPRSHWRPTATTLCQACQSPAQAVEGLPVVVPTQRVQVLRRGADDLREARCAHHPRDHRQHGPRRRWRARAPGQFTCSCSHRSYTVMIASRSASR